MNDVIVIIAHHKGEFVHNAIASLPCESIVVTSNEYDFNTHLPSNSILVSKNSPTHKRNVGVALTKQEYICFIDDDVTVNKDCIETMKAWLQTHEDTAMVYALLYTDDGAIDTSGSYLTWAGFLYETYEHITKPRLILSAKSACCMVKRELFNKVDGFDEDFVIYGEETDLSWRLWKLGYKTYMLSGATAVHHTKGKEYYNKEFIHYHGCKNYITMLIKNLPVHKLGIAFLNASIWATMGLLFILRGNRHSAMLIFKGVAYNALSVRKIWKKRSKKGNLPHICWRNPPLSYGIKRLLEYQVHKLHAKPR